VFVAFQDDSADEARGYVLNVLLDLSFAFGRSLCRRRLRQASDRYKSQTAFPGNESMH
jgi:hypothetical protein